MEPLLLLLAAAAGGGAEPDFCADRPGLATGTCIVPGGHVQLEFSLGEYSRTHRGDTTERDWTLLPTQLRIGLDQRTEVSLAMEPLLRSKVRSNSGIERSRGAGDLTFAFKRKLTGDGAKVTVDAMPFVTLPIGSRDFTAGKFSEGLLVPIDAELGGPWSLTLTPEAERNPNSEIAGHHWRGALSGELGYAVKDDLQLGLDGLIAREKDGAEHKREAQLGLSAAYQAGKNLQLDVEVDTGFARSSPDLTLITGVAVRF